MSIFLTNRLIIQVKKNVFTAINTSPADRQTVSGVSWGHTRGHTHKHTQCLPHPTGSAKDISAQ